MRPARLHAGEQDKESVSTKPTDVRAGSRSRLVGALLLLVCHACTSSEPPAAAVPSAPGAAVDDTQPASAAAATLDAATPAPRTTTDAASFSAQPQVFQPSTDGGSPGDAQLDLDATHTPDAARAAEAASPDATAAPVTAVPLTAQIEKWWAYERPPEYVVIKSDVDVPMRDGAKLGCTLYRPGRSGRVAEGKFPGIVVEFTPYVLEASINEEEASFFVERGYNALVCTVRGIGRSAKPWNFALSRQDGRDAHDLVEWLAVQPFSNGRMGQYGESYGGATSYGAAVEKPPHLLAIAPMQAPSSLYHDVIYPGGIEATARGTLNSWPPLAELISLGGVNADAEYAMNHAHPTYDAFWQDHTLLGLHAGIAVPVLSVGGWEDGFFRSGTLAAIEGAQERTWAIYGPYAHSFPVKLGECSACVSDPLPSGVLLAWFDHWLMERPGVPLPPKPTFVSFEGPKGSGRGFVELSRWAPEGSDVSTFYLGSGNVLSETAPVEAGVAFRQPLEPSDNGGSLTFTTEPFAKGRVLLGHPALSFQASLSAADANFYVELIDVDAGGKERFVNDGFLRASHHASHVTPTPVTPNQPAAYAIAIRAQHYRFLAGHRLRIRISGGKSDMLVPSAPVNVSLTVGATATLRMPGFAAP
ncbi:MAG: hypothetical protein RL385_3342 [Pseudomonadota bacterium]